MMGAKNLEDQLKDGTAKAEGDVSILGKLAATMVEFDPRFEVMPGTKADGAAGGAVAEAYAAETGRAMIE
jgi:hypothetical protein